MAKKVQETGVALVGQYTQNDIPQLVEAINAKIKSLQGDSDDSTRITGDIDMFGKLEDIKEPMKLMEVYNYVTKKINGVNEFIATFKAVSPTIPVPTMKIAGATLQCLQKEILLQYKKVTHAEELAKLRKAKEELESCLSEDMKVQAKLANVASILNLG